jgi:hypothetical protein
MSPGKAPGSSPGRFSAAPDIFHYLTRCAARGERVAYSNFAFDLGLGSPRGLGWLLTPLLRWCEVRGLPPLPIIVVRRADGLPSGGFDRNTIAAETARVFAFDWPTVTPPSAVELAAFARPRLPGGLQDLTFESANPC